MTRDVILILLALLIPLFVRWCAWQEISTVHGKDPDPVKLLFATDEVNAGIYYVAIDEANASDDLNGLYPTYFGKNMVYPSAWRRILAKGPSWKAPGAGKSRASSC